MERTLVASATNILASGYMVVPTDRRSPAGDPVNALFAIVRAIHRVIEYKAPARAVAVIGTNAKVDAWPPLLQQQLPVLPGLLRDLGIAVIEAEDEHHVVASYVQAARDAGDDVIVVGRDKRFAQLVTDHVWWYDSNKDVRYTADIVHKRFTVGPDAVADWLALVGDQEALPGVKGIGAKGATTIIETHGSLDAAMAQIDTLEGRIGKALRAVRDDVPRELARARLDRKRALPVPLAELSYKRPAVSALNAVYERLGLTELLTADESALEVDVDCFLAGRAMHALIEDDGSLAGVAITDGVKACYVPVGGKVWSEDRQSHEDRMEHRDRSTRADRQRASNRAARDPLAAVAAIARLLGDRVA